MAELRTQMEWSRSDLLRLKRERIPAARSPSLNVKQFSVSEVSAQQKNNQEKTAETSPDFDDAFGEADTHYFIDNKNPIYHKPVGDRWEQLSIITGHSESEISHPQPAQTLEQQFGG